MCTRRVLLVLHIIVVLTACATSPVVQDSGGDCAPCFWEYQPAELREELVAHYREVEIDDPLLAAERELLLARLADDPGRVCSARSLFEALARGEQDARRAALAAESAALLATTCGAPSAPAFRVAAEATDRLGEPWRSALYANLARGDASPRFVEPPPLPRLSAPADARAVVVGESVIEIDARTRIGAQLERVLRDWLSAQLAHDGVSAAPRTESLLDWHEGHQLRVIAGHTGARVLPLGRGLAARRGDAWFGADEDGNFRFEVLPDKTQYPTTRHGAGLALLADTHGFSAVVAQALHEKTDLVVGCGDSEGKMHAALHLARRGVSAYFPCDRFVGLLLGYDAPGTLIGSAPITLESGGLARVGGRPITIWRGERVVVQDASGSGEVRYHDAARRYFERLAEVFPLRLELVRVHELGRADAVVERAFASNARLIALRVANEHDAKPVLEWLDASPKNRALLFHSASYPAGRRVFDAFPGRTSFGDPRPRFVSSHEGS